MSVKKQTTLETKKALEKLTIETKEEFSIDDPKNLTSKETGLTVRELVKMGQKQLINKE
ncbi:MAG TPA: small acid-soluble spore protein [Tissierellales bacterium]|nr:small acid-soluble spore protein [Tissierellales bacterium]